MKLFVSRAQTFYYSDGVVDRRLCDVDLLETAHNTLAPCEVAVEFVVGGAADEADVALFEIGFQHV